MGEASLPLKHNPPSKGTHAILVRGPRERDGAKGVGGSRVASEPTGQVQRHHVASIQAARSHLQQRWIHHVHTGRRVADGGWGWPAEKGPATAR